MERHHDQTYYCACLDQDDESEYETDSEDEEDGRRLLKPVFVPKQAREVRFRNPGV